LLVRYSSSKHFVIRILAALVALLAFWLVWLLQLRLAVHLAQTIADFHVAGTYSNFVVFTSLLLNSALTISVVFLAITSISWRWLHQPSRA